MKKTNPFVFASLFVLILLFIFAIFSNPATTEASVIADNASPTGAVTSGIYRGVSTAVQFDVSPPLRDIPPAAFSVEAGTEMLCVVTADNSDFRLVARQAVPIGHKVALTDLAAGDTVIKYGQDIGRMVGPAARGEHVHVHNLKTKRW